MTSSAGAGPSSDHDDSVDRRQTANQAGSASVRSVETFPFSTVYLCGGELECLRQRAQRAAIIQGIVEREKGFEPSTSTLAK